MGFFSFLFRRPFYIGDAVFGRLRREEFDKETGRASFVAEDLLFTPTGQRIACFLGTSETGPTSSQQAFYRYIAQHYQVLAEQLIPLFEHSFRYRDAHFRIQNFTAEFQLTAISIPAIAAGQQEPVDWEWSFNSAHDPIHVFTVYMHDDTAEPTVQMDG